MPTSRAGSDARARGYTLVELLVVLVLIGLAVGLVAPAVLPPPPRDASSFVALIGEASRTAVRRGETVYLTVTRSGAWRMDGAVSPEQDALAAGQLQDYVGTSITLLVSPLGTCGFDLTSALGTPRIGLDPLTCEVSP